MVDKPHTDALIVGAGMAGLMAANSMSEQGLRVTVVEQGQTVGGRLATRSIGPGRADHGAQFFTVRTTDFRQYLNRWLDKGLVYEWSRGWSDSSLGATPPDGQPRYAVRGGMHALAAHLAQGLDIRLNTRIVSLTTSVQGWHARDDKGRVHTVPAILLTPPVPHVLDILNAGEVKLTPANRGALEAIQYASCLVGLFWIGGEISLPEPGAIHHPNAPITWIADNRRKGISPDATLITVHAGPEYSRQLWDMPDWQVLVALESGLRLFRDYRAHTVESHLVRWRYAMPITIHPGGYLIADDLPSLVFAGDAFGGPRIEGAALSGLAAGGVLGAQVT
ncbi:MAG: FAD-dependent oxidoreductase [Anaerolineae bacterium]|nr:FAD-dependent oxidoreductase [Anaerolineae bacterium]